MSCVQEIFKVTIMINDYIYQMDMQKSHESHMTKYMYINVCSHLITLQTIPSTLPCQPGWSQCNTPMTHSLHMCSKKAVEIIKWVWSQPTQIWSLGVDLRRCVKIWSFKRGKLMSYQSLISNVILKREWEWLSQENLLQLHCPAFVHMTQKNLQGTWEVRLSFSS